MSDRTRKEKKKEGAFNQRQAQSLAWTFERMFVQSLSYHLWVSHPPYRLSLRSWGWDSADVSSWPAALRWTLAMGVPEGHTRLDEGERTFFLWACVYFPFLWMSCQQCFSPQQRQLLVGTTSDPIWSFSIPCRPGLNATPRRHQNQPASVPSTRVWASASLIPSPSLCDAITPTSPFVPLLLGVVVVSQSCYFHWTCVQHFDPFLVSFRTV